MREAIGGTWIMGIVVFFVILFSSYLAISVNYSKAFKVKNEIILIIEKWAGHSPCAQEEIRERLDRIGYFVFSQCATDYMGFESGGGANAGVDGRYRYCIKKFQEHADPETSHGFNEHATMPRAYYTVGVFFRLDLPLFRDLFTFPVTGETKPINFPNESRTNCG